MLKQIPENGIGIFAGYTFSDNKEKFIIEEIIPNIPLKNNIYICNSTFYTEPLQLLLDKHDQHGLIIITGSETLFYHINQRDEKLLARITANLPSNHSMGGQSQNRIQRLRDEKIHYYLTKIGEKAIELFTENNLMIVKKVIIAGNAQLKDQLIPCIKPITNFVMITTNGLMSIKDLRTNFINNLLIDDEERFLVKEIDYLIETANDTLIYGIEEVNKYLQDYLVKTLIVHKEYEQLYKTSKLIENINVHYVNYHKVKDFGGVIGILYFVLSERSSVV